jgi:hypothetical protein
MKEKTFVQEILLLFCEGNMAEPFRQRKYKKTEEVLEVLFAMPSDDESVDSFEASNDDADADVGTDNFMDIEPASGSESDDDDDVLYQLADVDPVNQILKVTAVAPNRTRMKLIGIKMHFMNPM